MFIFRYSLRCQIRIFLPEKENGIKKIKLDKHSIVFVFRENIVRFQFQFKTIITQLECIVVTSLVQILQDAGILQPVH